MSMYRMWLHRFRFCAQKSVCICDFSYARCTLCKLYLMHIYPMHAVPYEYCTLCILYLMHALPYAHCTLAAIPYAHCTLCILYLMHAALPDRHTFHYLALIKYGDEDKLGSSLYINFNPPSSIRVFSISI